MFVLDGGFAFLALAKRGKEESSEIKIRLLKGFNSGCVQPLSLCLGHCNFVECSSWSPSTHSAMERCPAGEYGTAR